MISGTSTTVRNGADTDDLIHNERNGVTISGGDEFIDNRGSNVSIDGGAGNDTIRNSGDYVTINAGAGQDTFVYKGGNDVITNYQSGEILSFAATYTGWTTDGNVIAHVFKSGEYEGILDGRGFDKFEVIVGSDNVSNQIFSNEVGSSLWGGRGNSNDDLYGNIGADEYVYAYGNGQDNIYQAGSEDTVNLLNISLDQISGAEIKENGVTAQFTDGGSLNIEGQVGAFKLEGQVYHADYQNKSWS